MLQAARSPISISRDLGLGLSPLSLDQKDQLTFALSKAVGPAFEGYYEVFSEEQRVKNVLAELERREAELVIQRARGLEMVTSGQAKIESGQAKIESGQAKIESGQAKVESGQAKIASGEAKKILADQKLAEAEAAKSAAQEARLKSEQARESAVKKTKIAVSTVFYETFHEKRALTISIIDRLFSTYLSNKEITIGRNAANKPCLQINTMVPFIRYLQDNPDVQSCNFGKFQEKVTDIPTLAKYLASPLCNVSAVWIHNGISNEAKTSLAEAVEAKQGALTVNYL